jgi:pimeloyl-ACP methyl ester carboxylesterase
VRPLLPALLLLALTPACGDNGVTPPDDVVDAGPDAAPGDILEQLRALPGVTAEEWTPQFPTAGYRYFDLWFTEPVDHDDAGAGTFQLYASLQHRDVGAPMVVYTSGYDAGWTAWLTEPAQLVDGNQLSLEYRFYGTSKPTGGVPWPLLRIEQAAADEHDILGKLATIYDGNTIATGGSKGGELALQYAQLYPDDVDGVVAYVAPVITDLPDLRYDGILDRIGVASCRDALRAVSRRMLEHHTTMEQAAATLTTYEMAGVAHATETAIVELEFSFWMTRGEEECGAVPDATTATDEELFTFLVETGGPAAYGDEDLARYGSQYIYQDMVELGYPTWNHEYLDDLLVYSYEDWSAYLPPDEPTVYDPTHARALAAWVTGEAEEIMLVGGEWDPWGAGYPAVEPGRDAFSYLTPHGSHWSSGIYSIPPADQLAAVATLRRWAGLGRSTITMPRPLAPMATRGPTRAQR